VGDLALTFVGTGNAFADGGLCHNGFVVNGRYLFDCPPQVLMSLRRSGVDPVALDAVVISHHHGDHVLGLPFLLLDWKYHGRRETARIVGPAGTEEFVTGLAERVFPGVFETDYGIEWIVAEPGRRVERHGIAVTPVAVEHDPRVAVCLGFAAEVDGRRFGYTGDARLCDGVFELARGSELLVSECASRADRIPVHMNLVDDIPLVRNALDPAAPLVLTHIAPDVDGGGLPNTVVARDFATLRF
jgi:ribonuclease BN (tRNA processing enzyme)